jgi:hypothetical protein
MQNKLFDSFLSYKLGLAIASKLRKIINKKKKNFSAKTDAEIDRKIDKKNRSCGVVYLKSPSLIIGASASR